MPSPAFDNTYAALPDRFFTRMKPAPVRAPGLVALNDRLARDLGLDPEWLRSGDGIAMLAGNAVPEGAAPLAQAYAGHQFGGWVPQLGDGRALLLGEVEGPEGRRDLQLKGSGPTPYSRMGDGRAGIGPVLREYLVSEAMAALDVPTTRALAAVTTGETVLREIPLPGAVLARVAASHVRVGTFQYFAARQDTDALEALTDYVITRHYPGATDAFELLELVVAAQAGLIARWMSLGFIHGVMNTDNMAVSGETIDYGPCAFMDEYHPSRVFSSIDQFGRYAYGNQPQIAVWNLAQFASCLLPLMGEQDAAIERATEIVNGFGDLYAAAWLELFRAKLGLEGADPGDADLAQGLLDAMAAGRADFTLAFSGLADGTARKAFADPAPFDAWAPSWEARTGTAATAIMRRANPAVIPRNHHVEATLAAAALNDFDPFRALLAAVTEPFTPHPEYGRPPAPGEEVIATFCGT